MDLLEIGNRALGTIRLDPPGCGGLREAVYNTFTLMGLESKPHPNLNRSPGVD